MLHRGDVHWIDFGAPHGSAPALRRPALIVQSDGFNASRIATVVVAALTSNLRLASMPGNVFVSRGMTGLPKDSVVNVSQIATIDKSDVADRAGSLTPALLADVDDGIRLLLGV
ncbi:type II toxin-antitoxin system PemK/MazF family toxin [Mumia zhuanghuii]|uniref:mRNA interferase n=2 Tax=Mumia TaxID=1546255 RepID=A0ABW1QFA2_9ACTN|nr:MULTISPECIES: type II toxin-antitoxin system PemK/MazF family toxin [Mumia]KAA1422815.1 type II toxin-antitoxin system PemK/MazF family toxin [Mumia zhuanghuii]